MGNSVCEVLPIPSQFERAAGDFSPTALETENGVRLPAISTTIATTTTTTTASAAATAATTAAVATATTSTAASRLERLGLVDRQGTSGEFHAGKFLDRRLAFRLRRKLHECETARPSGVAIRDDSNAVYNSALREQIAQLGLGDFEREIPYVKSHVPSHLMRKGIGLWNASSEQRIDAGLSGRNLNRIRHHHQRLESKPSARGDRNEEVGHREWWVLTRPNSSTRILQGQQICSAPTRCARSSPGIPDTPAGQAGNAR
jgi:hypothetical protein